MKKASSFLLLLVAMLMSWPARAQHQLTVADGTTTNLFVPIYGYYTDAYLRAQMFYPGDSLVDMTGDYINRLTFYASTANASWGTATFEVKLGVTTSSFAGWITTPLTTVYTGSLSITGNQMTVNFATPYLYPGGDLLIEVNCIAPGSYASCSWYGVPLSGASIHGYSSSSWSAITHSNCNFMPKATFSYFPASGCAFPINLAVSGVDSAHATLSWSDTSGASAWRLFWYPTDSLSRMDSMDVTDTTYTLSGLDANTAYTVKVMTLCTGGNSPLMTATFRTECGATAIPYTTSFEDVDVSMIPYCWTHVSNSYSTAYTDASIAHTGSNFLRIWSYTGGGTQIIALPVVNNISSLRLNFYAACVNHNFVLEAGVMEDSVFVPVDTVPLTTATSINSNTYNQYFVYYSNYTGTGNKMALRITGTANYAMTIDDLTIEVIPDCPDPSRFTLDSVGTDWAALSWVDNGSISSWVLEYDTVPFTPGTAIHAVYPTNDYTTLMGLDTGHTYYAYLHGICGGDTTRNLYLVFSTLVGEPATLPYICGFEGNGNDGWEFVQNGQVNHWLIDTATHNGGSKSLYITNYGTANSYSTNSQSISYAYRLLSLPDTGEYLYAFDWKGIGEGDYDYLRAWLAPATAPLTAGQLPDGSTNTYIYYRSNPSGWIPLDGGSDLNRQTSWQSRTGTFRLHRSGTYMMVFMWANDGSGGSNPPAAIDNVELSLNACPAPYGLTVSDVGTDEATLHWYAGGTESMWSVFDGTNYYIAYDTTYTIHGLTPDADYHFVVRALCGAGDSSFSVSANAHTYPSCSRPFNFAVDHVWGDTVFLTWSDTTGASSFQIVYGPVGFNPDTVVINSVIVSSGTAYPVSGLTIGQPYQFYLRINCTVDNSAWVGPLSATPGNVVTMGTTGTQTINNACGTIIYDNGGATGNYASNASDTLILYPDSGNILCLYGTSNLESCCDHLYILDGVGTSGTILASSSTSAVNTVIDTVTSTSGPLTILFTSDGYYVRSGYELFTYCIPAPTCPDVVDLAVTGNTATSLTIDWVEVGTATQWEAFISTSATDTPTADSTIYTTPGLTFNGLTTGTIYCMWVRPVCSSDTGQWTGPVFGIPGSWIMRANRTDTVRMCGGAIYDDGGPMGGYSSSQNSTIIIMPDAPNSLVQISGSSYTHSIYDYITIYDGAGTSGTRLWTDSVHTSTNRSFGPFISSSGPITVTMTSDSYFAYEGFEINVSCVSAYCRLSGLMLDASVPASSSQLALTWTGNSALYYEVEYGTPGFTPGTGTPLTTYTNSIVITGLTRLTTYEVHVRSICSATDTGNWASGTFQTTVCDNAVIAESWDNSMTAVTSNYAPMGYSHYNYGYVQTLVDSARFAAIQGEITAFAFKPATATGGNYFNHITVYMANVPENNLTSVITPDANHLFVKVIDDRDMCYSDDSWQIHSFDTAFIWDGHSNVLVAVKRDHGSFGSSASFQGHSTARPCTRYYYKDSGPISITNPSGTNSSLGYVGDFRFYSCDTTPCVRPVITSLNCVYQSATIVWNGTGTAYEVSIKSYADPRWSDTIAVSGNSYTFTGLQPATVYYLRVRQDCNAAGLGYSRWSTVAVITDSLLCEAPSNFAVSNITHATASFNWTPVGDESAWEVRVWNTTFDTTYTAWFRRTTVRGLAPGVTYNASIRALCGEAQNVEGLWGDTLQFTTATCPQVTGLATSNVTFNSVSLTWNAVAGAQAYRVIYESGQLKDSMVVTTASHTFSALQPNRQYTFYVRTICSEGWLSETSAQVTAHTAEAPDNVVTLTVAVNDASMGLVTINGSHSSTYIGLPGDVVTLAAEAYRGHAFVSWSDGNNANPRSYTLPAADATLSATFRQGVGIDEVAGATCTLHPNPAEGTTTVTVAGISGKVRIALLDLSGREVLGRELSILNSQFSISLDLKGLAAGAYFVRITSEQDESQPGHRAPLLKKLIVR